MYDWGGTKEKAKEALVEEGFDADSVNKAVVTPVADNELAMHMVVWYYNKLVQGDTTDIVEPAAGSSSTTTTTTTTTPGVSESLLRTYVQNKFNKLVEEDSSVLNDIDNTTVKCE